MISDNVTLLPVADILPDWSARREVSDEDAWNLAESIAKDGLIHTLVVDESQRLIVGGHRLRAWQLLAEKSVLCPFPDYQSWKLIPVRFASDFSEADLARIELIENLKRRNLSWREEATSIKKIHDMQKAENISWGQEATAKLLGTSIATINRAIIVAGEDLDDPDLANCDTINSAYGIVSRKLERRKAAKLESILTGKSPAITVESLFSDESADDESANEPAPEPSAPEAVPPSPIICSSFEDFAADYSGDRFNFLHCDFPYGIDIEKGPGQMKHGPKSSYVDSPDVYWNLLETLARHQKKLLAESCHIMFWFSQNFRRETEDFFSRHLPRLTRQSHLMIWDWSDDKGIAPDTQRYGRRNYETALCFVGGDRKIVKLTELCQRFPGTGEWRDRAIHRSEKPLPILRGFFKLFVDSHTIMLDPTCGSGTSLRIASEFGAKSLVGVELDPDMAAKAARAFVQHSSPVLL